MQERAQPQVAAISTGWPFGELEPSRHFKAILADPPWHFRARTALTKTNWTSRRDAEKHYRVMGIDDICALPVGALASRDAHLFLCVTGPMLPKALRVMEAWGFRYSGVAFTWVKLKRKFNPRQLRVLPTADGDFHFGLGLTTRKNAEYVLLGRRGSAKRQSKSVRELILAPVREHSRKPAEIKQRIEQYCDGPYLELFSRESREGWTCWGDQAGLFEAPA